MILELIIAIIIGVIFIFCGLLLGKNISFLSGYKGIEKLLSPESKNILSNKIKKAFLISGQMLIAGCTIATILNWVNLYLIFLMLPPILATIYILYITDVIVYARLRMQTKMTIGIFLIAIILTTTFGWYSSREATITVDKLNITISGLYGEIIPVSMIDSVSILEKPPKVILRTNGLAIGEIQKGEFRLSNGQNATLFICRNMPPYLLLILRNGKIIIINSSTNSEVYKYYEQIKKIL